MTFAQSVQKAFGQSWKLSLHWTKKVQSFLGLVLSKVSGLQTLVHDEEELEDHAERVSLSIAMERLLNMIIPVSS